MRENATVGRASNPWVKWWATQYGPPGTYFGLGEPTSPSYDVAKAFAVKLSKELYKEEDFRLYLDQNKKYIQGSLWYMEKKRFIALVERVFSRLNFRDEQLHPYSATTTNVVLGVLARYERCGGMLVEALDLLEILRAK
jgi:hypothetical protein